MAFLTRNTRTVRLPPLDRSSGWTTWIFQILLIVQAGQGCRGSKCCRVIFFRFWVLHKKRLPRKLVNRVFEFSVPIFSVCLNVYLSLEKVRKSFSIYEVKVCFLLYNLLYQVSQFPLPTEHLNHRKKWRICYRWNTTGFHEWTGGTFIEPCILLHSASNVQSFLLVI